jgi:hypothetical protein
VKFKGINLQGVNDPTLRSVLISYDREIRRLWKVFDAIVKTDGGRVIVKGALAPREVPFDPTTHSTEGSVGEVVQYNGSWYRKVANPGIDTNWEIFT